MNHSDKAKQTLDLMNTEHAAWRLATIKWEKRLAWVPTKVICSTCKGKGKVWVDADHKVICAQYDTGNEVRKFLGIENDRSGCLSYRDIVRWEKESGNNLTACPRCPTRRNYYAGTGEVVELREREVLIGIVVWDPGTEFTSRFTYVNGLSATNCELCAKGINRSHRVPVQGVTRTGKPVGMWIGADCAQKILGIAAKLKKDEFLAENLKEKA